VTALAHIADDRREPVAVARVQGEIDASNAPWIAARLRTLLTNRSDALAVDLTATTYLDSAGIALMFELAAELRLHQQELHLVVTLDSPIARVVHLTGLDAAVPIHASLEAALAQLGGD
jgi:anti-sigma B factor antagonist